MDEKEIIQYDIADMVMERPYKFSIDNRKFTIYPVTIGKSYLLHRLISSLEINNETLQINPFLEALRLCSEKMDIVSKIIAYHVINTKEQLFDDDYVGEIASYIKDNADVEDVAKVLLFVMTNDKVSLLIKQLGIEDEKVEQKRVLAIKNKDSNCVTYGGKTIYGSLIDLACERYGWPLDYVVWGISYANLRMLMADMITTISLTKEERKKARIRTDGSFINGDDASNIERIRAMFPD